MTSRKRAKSSAVSATPEVRPRRRPSARARALGSKQSSDGAQRLCLDQACASTNLPRCSRASCLIPLVWQLSSSTRSASSSSSSSSSSLLASSVVPAAFALRVHHRARAVRARAIRARAIVLALFVLLLLVLCTPSVGLLSTIVSLGNVHRKSQSYAESHQPRGRATRAAVRQEEH
jgi:hypothetical protein